ncbi:MAG: hypothetical protein Greene041614_556 [Parcubacteria group bacterium Greene0416_14]|nr:MAG: hypothetical protein Greene041614_556 [Parcubacteria group bacterium Greene0416_14]TSD00570.1 MAG: hypothetical protein Greene101415_791 [Parcubacteria group bacterium Greene1014_15]TSD08263.1 MAG: hypothetical protein Greene07144_245 [Parcubacteria group bacterium Greene0714_4]
MEPIKEEQVKFSSPQEEISFLREQVAQKEKELLDRGREPHRGEIIKNQIEEYKAFPPESILAPVHHMPERHVEKIALDLAPEEHDKQMEELLAVLVEEGLRNTLSVLDKMHNPHLEDDFHRYLVQYVNQGIAVAGMKEGGPEWKATHMTLYEVQLPEHATDEKERTLKELISSMEQFYSGMLSVGNDGTRGNDYFTIEIALPNFSEEVSFYVAVPNHKRDLFEKHILSIFHDAKIEVHKDDYNIFNEEGAAAASSMTLAKSTAYPIKLYEHFDYDPLNVIINSFSKIERDGEGAALQLVFHPRGALDYADKYKEVIKKIERGVPVKKAVESTVTMGGKISHVLREMVFGDEKSKDKDGMSRQPTIDQTALEILREKIASPIVMSNIRLVTSAGNEQRAGEILSEMESAFNQFSHTGGNTLRFERLRKGALAQMLHQFSFREFNTSRSLPFSIRELTTMVHFPPKGIKSSPHLKQAKAGTSSAPHEMPTEGTLLGVNTYRNVTTKAYMTKEDRVRHMYVIGQTGTGKTTLLKNMIAQDIAAGAGVCMIDPHGSDIVDILSYIPPERYGDVIYFDPAYTPRPMALNMLEYDARFPEQKTFVVNELFSIFDKLFDLKTTGGPIFEQYFRNASMLVIDDPNAGSTLLEVSRVLADKAFRDKKLAMCTNPIIVQFWREIATKAGGESSLENMVPYITSKFDVFLSNDIMRPIIAQERSSFNFRRIMDEKKIFLVNLSKGRLGDINSRLIGLILVGKILMAALSRVDAIGSELSDFYLYLDEFQNITTDSIATILSEARKYRLSLNVAHQFIAQLDEKIKNAVFGNVGSIAAFRVGAEDAEFLEKQFEPVFKANDLMNLDNRNAYLRMLINGKPAKPFNIETIAPPVGYARQVESLKEVSYHLYGSDRAEIEAQIMEKYRKVSV